MIIVVRHGETALNLARVLQPANEPLNTRGLRQAELLAQRVAGLGGGALISSDLPRARMTAEAIARTTSLEVELEPLLQERNFGALRGRPYDEVGAEIWAAGYQPPEGESIAMFDARVVRAWDAVAQRANRTSGNLIVVTHGMVCGSIAKQFLSFAPPLQAPGRWGNTSVTVCEPQPPHLVSVLNCVEHLADETTARDGTAPSGL